MEPQYVETLQGWLLLGIFPLFNLIGYLLVFKPEKMFFLSVLPDNIQRKIFRFGFFYFSLVFDVLVIYLIATGQYPFN